MFSHIRNHFSPDPLPGLNASQKETACKGNETEHFATHHDTVDKQYFCKLAKMISTRYDRNLKDSLSVNRRFFSCLGR